MKAWRMVVALAVWTGVVLQLGLMLHGKAGADLGHAVVKYLSFFTILSNIAVGLVLAAPLVATGSTLARWAQRASTRVAAGVYIVITAVVYHWLLASRWHPTGLQWLADTLLHTATPALFLLDVLARPSREAAKWGSAWKALVFPLAYGGWTLLHGALTGYWPYPFFDVPKRGYPAVLVTMLVMGAGFYVVTLALTGLQHLQGRLAKPTPAPISA